MIKSFLSLACLVGLGGCAAERAMVAQDAQTKMVGLSKEQVFACMGVPASKATEGSTEIWSYNSGNGHTTVSGYASGNGNFASAGAVASTRYCIINVVITGGMVSKVNYSGPTGGLITGGEQCAFAVRNCVPPSN